MKITSAEFIDSAVKPEQYPRDSLSEVAFFGRSNVGKSSLINTLLNRKKLVKTSSTPGKTQQINFFKINKSFYFVDLPGYGFAKVPLEVRKKWKPMIKNYLTCRQELVLAVMLVDSRYSPTNTDVIMKEWLDFNRIPTVVVATKADKISTQKGNKYIKEIGQHIPIKSDDSVVLFSAKVKIGKKELWKFIDESLKL